MSKHSKQYRAGIDVSKDWFDVERVDERGEVETARFDNDGGGHRKVCSWLTKRGHTARVVMEATGVYHLNLARALDAKKGIEVMVANPMAVKSFGNSLLQRATTDATAAHVLREFAQRMEFVQWSPPSRAKSDLRALARRLETLTDMRTEEKNRLHAGEVDGEPVAVLKDIRANIAALEKRLDTLREAALGVVEGDQGLKEQFEKIVSMTGLGNVSAIAVLGEVAFLSTEMHVGQWVAYAGLDPRPIESGSSVKMPRRISKMGNVHIRRALYMPALVAMRHDPNVKAFAERLEARGKAKLVVVVAVMRKMLHAIYGMLKTRTNYDPEKFYRTIAKAGA